jgi:peptidoglycan hydrolase CwlO-like protein
VKTKLLPFIAMSMFVAASPAFAVHDHGPQNSAGQGASKGSMEDQSAKEAEKLLNSCAQQVASIQKRINKLQAETAGRRVGASVRDELKKLEQKLKEANEIVKPLQIF